MSNYEIYSLIIAITVFVIFAVLFGVMVGYMVKTAIKLIRYGDEDKTILKEKKYILKTPSKRSKLERAFSTFLSAVLVAIFVVSLCISCTENEFERGISTFKIVKSDSMATKNEKNEYLFENDLNDQFETFDIVMTKPLPKEEDLKLYDIVVYERDGMLVIHRIVAIEEPNSKHSERYFKTQGDAISRHDIYPVLYSQMHAIYTGERIPYVGSFIMFVQSPAGWLCFILILFAILIMPVIEKKLLEEMKKRLALLEAKSEESAPIIPKTVPAPTVPEQVAISATAEPVSVPEPRVAPAPVSPKPIPIPEFKSDYKPVSRPRIIEERAPETVTLEKRKPIAPSYRIVPLDVTPPKPERVRVVGEFDEKGNMRYHVVPLLLDKEGGKKFGVKPLTRYVKVNLTDRSER